MISIELDENGEPKSTIKIDEMIYAQLKSMLDDSLLKMSSPVVATMMCAMQKAYRCGWAQCGAAARKKVEEQGEQIGVTEHGDKVYAISRTSEAPTCQCADVAAERVYFCGVHGVPRADGTYEPRSGEAQRHAEVEATLRKVAHYIAEWEDGGNAHHALGHVEQLVRRSEAALPDEVEGHYESPTTFGCGHCGVTNRFEARVAAAELVAKSAVEQQELALVRAERAESKLAIFGPYVDHTGSCAARPHRNHALGKCDCGLDKLLKEQRPAMHLDSFVDTTVTPEEIRKAMEEPAPSLHSPPLTHSAIRVEGVVWSLPKPYRHHHVLGIIREYSPVKWNDADEKDQGFLDAAGKYLTRDEAEPVAFKNKQVKNGRLIGGPLTSEDLW